jgi:hypothetical protein
MEELMIPDDVKPILHSLLERSRRREVEWLPASASSGEGDYVVLFPSSSLVLEEDHNGGRIHGRILNKQGDIAHYFAAYRDDENYDPLEELVELARRKVLNADDALAEIRAKLSAPGRVGETPQPRRRVVVQDDDEEVPF